jgi:hypothetical protein
MNVKKIWVGKQWFFTAIQIYKVLGLYNAKNKRCIKWV